MTTRALAALLSLAAFGAACGGPPRVRFPARAPLEVDPDMAPFRPRPQPYVSPEVWDTVDNILFEPLTRALAVRRIERAANATALDEVADSSWFQNRVGRADADAAAIAARARGPCGEDPDPAGPWIVTRGKPNGANKGFMLKHASGRRFLFKLDGGPQGERASAADVIGSRIYHAAGYHVPCNRVAFLDPRTLSIAPDATAEDFIGDKVPFSRAMLEAVLASGRRDASGRIRGGLSELLPGKPLGPWSDFGTRPDDPNDVIPHEDRRELRGSYIFAALVSHYDAREQNALDIWIETDPGSGSGYVRHYMLDFGDGLGSLSSWGRISRRRGHAYEIDWGAWFADTWTLGLLSRPWRDPSFGPGGPTLGYFSADNFEPDRFRTAYPYGPFTRLTEEDGAWGARILARISPALIRAIVAEARFSDPTVHAAALAALLGRRDKLLRRYLGRLSPLAAPRLVSSSSLCVTDRLVESGLTPAASRPVTARHGSSPLRVRPGAAIGESCADTSVLSGDYAVIDFSTPTERVLRVHLARTAADYQVVGLER